MKLSVEREKSLLEQALQGNEIALETLLKDCRTQITCQIRMVLRCEQDVDDVYQEACVRAWNKLHTFKGDCRFSTWLAKIAIRKAKEHNETHQRRSRLTNGEMIPLEPETTPHVFELRRDMYQRELEAALKEEIQNLPERQKQVFMKCEEGYSCKEIALALMMKENTVRVTLFNARANLQKLLCARGFGPDYLDAA